MQQAETPPKETRVAMEWNERLSMHITSVANEVRGEYGRAPLFLAEATWLFAKPVFRGRLWI